MTKTEGAAGRGPGKRVSATRVVRRGNPNKERAEALSFSSSGPITTAVPDNDFEIAKLERKYDPKVLRRARRMRLKNIVRINPKLARTAGLGLLSVSLYALLYRYEREVLLASVSYSWSFMVPASIALVFSLVHGSFTGAFWDALGMKPRTVRK